MQSPGRTIHKCSPMLGSPNPTLPSAFRLVLDMMPVNLEGSSFLGPFVGFAVFSLLSSRGGGGVVSRGAFCVPHFLSRPATPTFPLPIPHPTHTRPTHPAVKRHTHLPIPKNTGFLSFTPGVKQGLGMFRELGISCMKIKWCSCCALLGLYPPPHPQQPPARSVSQKYCPLLPTAIAAEWIPYNIACFVAPSVVQWSKETFNGHALASVEQPGAQVGPQSRAGLSHCTHAGVCTFSKRPQNIGLHWSSTKLFH